MLRSRHLTCTCCGRYVVRLLGRGVHSGLRLVGRVFLTGLLFIGRALLSCRDWLST